MNSIIPFHFDDHDIRIVDHDGNPWFVARDVAVTLGYRNVHDAITTHCKGGRKTRLPSKGGDQEYTIIPESDVYRLVIRSKLPEAERFEKWVMEDVLPSIRKNGSYGVLTREQRIAQSLIDAVAMLEEQKPAVDFYNAVTDSKDAVDMAQVAKVLDVGMGRNRLFQFLRGHGVLRYNNEPYQSYIDRGWFCVIEQSYKGKYSETHVKMKTLVYQKGIDGIRRLIEKTENLDNPFNVRGGV